MATVQTASPVAASGRRRWARALDYFILLALFTGAAVGVLVVKFNQPIYFLLGVATLAVSALAAMSVEFGLLVLVFMTYTRFSDIVIEYYNAPSVAKAYVAVLVLAILIRWVILRDRPKGWAIPAIILGLYGLLGFASVIYSPVPDRVLAKAYDFLKNSAITILIIVLLQRGRALRGTIWTLIIVGFFLGTLSVFQYFTRTFDRAYGGFAQASLQQIVGSSDNYRIGGPIGDPNFFAQIMIVLVPIALERTLHEKRLILRAVALWTMLMSVACVIFSYSRGGLLALVVCLMAWFLVNPPGRLQLPILIISMVLAIIYIIPAGYVSRVMELGQFFQTQGTLRTSDPSLRGRISENLAAWDMFRTHPLFGVGWNTYPYLFPFYSKEIGLANVATEREAHNLYLEVAAETGIVGLFAFGLILFSSLRDLVRARRHFMRANLADYAWLVTGFGIGFLGYLVAALFIHGAFQRYFHVLLGIAWSMPLVVQNTLREKGLLHPGP